MRRLLFLVALGAAGALLMRSFLFEGIYLKTDSMAPTLPQGSHVFVNKLVFHFREPRRGEVVMFHTPQQPDHHKDLVKRVIAIEGDVIEIKKKKVFLNRAPLQEPYIQNTRPYDYFESDTRPAITIPKGYVFVMGDNRDESGDSRDWRVNGEWSPYVPISSIKGLVSRSK